ncbi:MAG: pantoate--beta-alanine ligase [Gammaproteobacteria bacterium]
MQQVTNVPDLRKQVRAWHTEGLKIALVPTMGNFHAGHLALVEKGKSEADRTIVSIFVNPIQFVEGEDYEDYPRTIKSDLDRLAELDTDLVFIPEVNELFPKGLQEHTRVTVPKLDSVYCGEFRPGHFTGVATIVAKLLNLVQPDIAIFGDKDYQQLLVIRRLVNDLAIPVEILGFPTDREQDGLAMSSRNHYLSKEERKLAPCLYETLKSMANSIMAGEYNYKMLEKKTVERLLQIGFRPEYVNVCNAEDLGKPGKTGMVILAAAWLGKSRMIDNVAVRHYD